VMVSVRDSGCGISSELQREIFQPFFTTKKKGRGTGLGLSTCAAIVRQLGGLMTVESSEGRGSVFRIHLPLKKRSPRTDELHTRTVFSVNQESFPGVVMLVDDDEVFRRSALRLLSALGFRARGFAGGEEAVAFFGNHRDEVGAVILDMLMPKMDGRRTFRKLKRIDDSVVVVLCSAEKSDDVKRLLAKGANGFLRKPFDGPALHQTLAHAVFSGGQRQ
jgi:two-component system cell cycle sensor histidine kinase/response regulator CckA